MVYGFVVRSLYASVKSVVCPGELTCQKSTDAVRERPPAAARIWARTGTLLLAAVLLGGLALSPLEAQTASFVSAVAPLGGGFQDPSGVVVDGNGNVYVGDYYTNTVTEMPAGCASSACVETLGGGFASPEDVAVDGSGNVYVADFNNNAVKEIPAGCIMSMCVTVLAGGFSKPIGVAIDKNGNVYVGDYGNNAVKEIPSGCTMTSCVVALGGGFTGPFGVAVDGSGNVYVADNGNNAVKEIPAGCTSANYMGNLCTVTTLGTGFSGPGGVAVDGSGNVYVADSGHSLVKEMTPGCTTTACITTLNGTFNQPYGVAVDANSNVYVADTLDNAIKEIMGHGVDAGTVAVGTTGPAVTLYFTFTAGGSGISASVLTQGARGLDFADAGTGTCDTNGTSFTYSTGASCTVIATIAPKYTGARFGAVELSDASGIIANAYIYGAGQGPQVTFLPGAESPVGIGLEHPSGAAVDASGNVYITDTNNDRLLKETLSAGSYTQTIVASYFTCAYGVAVDGAGNVFVSDCSTNEVFLDTPSGGGYYTQSVLVSTGLSYPAGLAVDGSGRIYIVDSHNNRVLLETPSGGAYTQSILSTSGLSDPLGVAVDGSGNVYIADSGNSRVVKETLSAGAYTQSVLASSLDDPVGVAVDQGGNVYISESGNNAVVKETPSGGSYSQSTVTTSALNSPHLVSVDESGDLYIADVNNNRILQENYANPPSFSFANTLMGAQSSDSPKTATVSNIGNQSLTFPIPGSGENPNVSANFKLDSATTCPEVLSSSSSAGTLAAETSCALALDFMPATAGALTGSAVLTDDNLNLASATQSIGLSGIGTTSGHTTPTVTVTSSSSSITTGQSLQVTVTVSGSPTPTGSVTLSSGSYTSSPATLVSGSASITVSAGALTVGYDTLTGTYTPDSGSSPTYNSASGTAPVTVTQAVGSCTNPNPNPNPNSVSFANPGDFNGDCRSNVLWRNTSSEEDWLWFLNGTSILNQGAPDAPPHPPHGLLRVLAILMRMAWPMSCGKTAAAERSTCGC